jgi:hypothetical protein
MENEPHIFLGLDVWADPKVVLNGLRSARHKLVGHVAKEALAEFDSMLKSGASLDDFMDWGDRHQVWLGSQTDFLGDDDSPTEISFGESKAKGKKFSKTYTDSKTGRKRTVSYGAKGYKIKPGTSAGDSYCARSYGISQKAGYDCAGKDRNKPNCLSRKKWHCHGKKSVKEHIDDVINDMLAVSFQSDPKSNKVHLGEPHELAPEDNREAQIGRSIIQLAQELVDLHSKEGQDIDIEFEEIEV